MRTEKKCSKCAIIKPLNEFYLRGNGNIFSRCKECNNIKSRDYRRTKIGLAYKMYSRQICNSKQRGHQPPTHTKKEFIDWIFSKPEYHTLHAEWVKSNYDKSKVPSCDRLDDYKTYSFDNIRIVTWEENSKSYDHDKRTGKNNKENSSVFQYSLSGEFIQEFHSRREAHRATGIHVTSIGACANGKVKTAGGFVWRNQK